MIDYKELEVIGKQTGFTHIAPLDCSTIQLLPEVRQMCANNTCHMYGKNWSCPPGCGTLEECEARVRQYTHGILVQTVGNLEDSMDVETMMETEAEHKKHFFALEEQLRAKSHNAPHWRRMLYQMQGMYLPGQSLPLPGQNLCLHGSLRNAGNPGVPGQ